MTDYDALLDAHLAGEEHGEDIDYDEPPPPVTSLDELDRLLFRLRLVADAEEQIAVSAQRRLDDIVRWRDDITSGLRRKRAWLDRAATGFAASHFAAVADKVRTVKVPNGEIRRRPQQDRVLDVEDGIATVIHARFPDLAPACKPKIAKAVVKERCDVGKALAANPDEDGYVPHQAVLNTVDTTTGEVTRTPVPGLVIMVSKTDKISAHPTAATKEHTDG